MPINLATARAFVSAAFRGDTRASSKMLESFINGDLINASLMTKGTGVSLMESHYNGTMQAGSLKHTKILIDLTGLTGSATDLDIIGNAGGTASAHIGQVVKANHGTLIAGMVTCLEVPAGCADDIDFYAATESTGAQDGLITSLTETALITAGGAWTAGQVKGMTSLPPDESYLYVVNGEGAAGGAATAGKFLIELWGY
jgi:hypothetical protein